VPQGEKVERKGREKENSIEGYPPGINLAWKLMPGGNYMGGVPFLGVYLSVEPMISLRGSTYSFSPFPLQSPSLSPAAVERDVAAGSRSTVGSKGKTLSRLPDA
jgi:hypothetical protein